MVRTKTVRAIRATRSHSGRSTTMLRGGRRRRGWYAFVCHHQRQRRHCGGPNSTTLCAAIVRVRVGRSRVRVLHTRTQRAYKVIAITLHMGTRPINTPSGPLLHIE